MSTVTITGPVNNAAFDPAQSLTVTWTFSSPNGAQIAYRLQATQGTTSYNYPGTPSANSYQTGNTLGVTIPAHTFSHGGGTVVITVSAFANADTTSQYGNATVNLVADRPPDTPVLTDIVAPDYVQPITAAWRFSDPDSGDSQSAYHLIVLQGITSVYDQIITSPTESHTFPANTFLPGTTYAWEVATYDSSGIAGPFSAQSTFTTQSPPNAPALGTLSGTDPTLPITMPWTFSDPDAGDTQSAYQVLIQHGGVTALDTGKVLSTAAQYILAPNTLTNGFSYTWQVRTWDAAAHPSAYSLTQTFLATTGPRAPIVASVAPFDATGAKTFSWTFQPGPAGTTQGAYEVLILQSTGATVLDTGKVTSTSVSYALAANVLSNGLTYTLQVRTWDNNQTEGPYSAPLSFNTSAPPTVTIISPTASAVIGTSAVTIQWGTFDPESRGQSAYQLLLTDGADVVLWDSGKVLSITARSASPNYALISGNTYKLKLTAWDGDGLASVQQSVTFTTNFTTALAPLLLISGSPLVAGGIVAGAANPPGGTAASLEIHRAPSGSSFIRLATFAPPAQPTITGTPTRVADNLNRANRAVTITSGNTLSLPALVTWTTPAWTLEVLAQAGAAGATRAVMNVQGAVTIELDATDHPVVTWRQGIAPALVFTAELPLANAESWHLYSLAVTIDANDIGTFWLYIDGQLTLTDRPAVIHQITGIDLGHFGGAEPLNGPIAAVHVSNAIRTVAQIVNTWTNNQTMAAEADTAYLLDLNAGYYLYHTYFDAGTASGQSYDYKATAVTSGGLATDSGLQRLTTVFDGVWLHDPTNVLGTLYEFQYDEARDEVFTQNVTLLQFQGRSRPVAEFAPQASFRVKASLVLLKSRGDEVVYKSLTKFARVLCYRDARGRKVYGVVSAAPVVDQFGFATADLSVDEVDYTEAI